MDVFCLRAHPDYYDYMHTITFLDAVKVELFYGECQGTRYEAVGEYSMTDTTLTISNLKEVDNDSDDNTEQPNTVVYKFRKETGLYEWVDDLTGESKSKSERYIFDEDPCGVDDGQVIFYRM